MCRNFWSQSCGSHTDVWLTKLGVFSNGGFSPCFFPLGPYVAAGALAKKLHVEAPCMVSVAAPPIPFPLNFHGTFEHYSSIAHPHLHPRGWVPCQQANARGLSWHTPAIHHHSQAYYCTSQDWPIADYCLWFLDFCFCTKGGLGKTLGSREKPWEASFGLMTHSATESNGDAEEKARGIAALSFLQCLSCPNLHATDLHYQVHNSTMRKGPQLSGGAHACWVEGPVPSSIARLQAGDDRVLHAPTTMRRLPMCCLYCVYSSTPFLTFSWVRELK